MMVFFDIRVLWSRMNHVAKEQRKVCKNFNHCHIVDHFVPGRSCRLQCDFEQLSLAGEAQYKRLLSMMQFGIMQNSVRQQLTDLDTNQSGAAMHILEMNERIIVLEKIDILFARSLKLGQVLCKESRIANIQVAEERKMNKFAAFQIAEKNKMDNFERCCLGFRICSLPCGYEGIGRSHTAELQELLSGMSKLVLHHERAVATQRKQIRQRGTHV